MKWLAIALISVFLTGGSSVLDMSKKDHYVLDTKPILVTCKDWERIVKKLAITTDYWAKQAKKCPQVEPSCVVEHMMFAYSLDKLRIAQRKLQSMQVGDGKGEIIPNRCPRA